jgi:cob(I)alamin adenosyltransferase
MARKSGIYTKGGDRGETSLIGGNRVSKSHPRIEAYGEVDELMAHTTLLRDMIGESSIRDGSISEDLSVILDIQMTTSAVLAVESAQVPEGIPQIGNEQIKFLENRIDEIDANLEPLHSFLIPGGHPVIAQAHVARTVCRRTERAIVRLAEEHEIDEKITRFYNRLSDYFFVLSRKIAGLLGVEQRPWKGML